jgi:hypothetical protein
VKGVANIDLYCVVDCQHLNDAQYINRLVSVLLKKKRTQHDLPAVLSGVFAPLCADRRSAAQHLLELIYFGYEFYLFEKSGV